MRVKISETEWFPIYVEGEHGIAVDVPDELVERWREVEARFKAIQDEVDGLYGPTEKALIAAVIERRQRG